MFDKLPKNYQDTIVYVDPIIRQTLESATPNPCEKSRQCVSALDRDADHHYVLAAKPIKKDPQKNLISTKFTLQLAQTDLQLKKLVHILKLN